MRVVPMFGERVARLTGLEPATPGVTGRYSNQLSYNRVRSGVPNASARVKRDFGDLARRPGRGSDATPPRMRSGRLDGAPPLA